MSTKKVTKKSTAKKAVKKTIAAKKAVVKKSLSARKQATKKSVTKSTKSTTKKTSSRAKKKPLVYASDQACFWVTNGQVLDSLVALRDALDEMEKEVYSYHAGQAQNDFANWVSDVLVDKACATDLKKAKTPRVAKTTVVRHLKLYSV